MSEQRNPFEGFEPANTTPVPDIVFDELMADLSNAELRVLLYIIRRTYGFKKVADAISFNQFMEGIKTRDGRVLDKGCGVKNRTTLSKALASLETRKCIVSSKGKDPLGDNMTTVYSIRFRAKEAQAGGSIKTVLPVVSKSYQGGNGNGLPVVSKSYPQETVIQKTVKQETDRQERDSASTNNSQNSTTKPTPPTPQKTSFKQKEEILLTPQGKRITDLYQDHKKRKMVFNEIDMVAANKLGQALEQDADFLDILKEIDQDDFINKRGVRVDLDYIWRKLNGFLDVIHRKRNGKGHSTSSSTVPSQPQERQSVLVSNEARERNLAKLRASVAQAK